MEDNVTKEEREEFQSPEQRSSPKKKENLEVIPDQHSDATHKTKQSKRSVKSNKSGKSDFSDKRQRLREAFEWDKNVEYYKEEKKIENLNIDYEYKSEEDSIFQEEVKDEKRELYPLASQLKTIRTLFESGENKKFFRDMVSRFSEKSQSYEMILKFKNILEKTDESSITETVLPLTPDLVDQMERRRFIRKELKENQEDEIFCKANVAVEKNLFEFFIDIIAKSN